MDHKILPSMRDVEIEGSVAKTGFGQPGLKRFVIHGENGTTYSLPPHLIDELSDGNPDSLIGQKFVIHALRGSTNIIHGMCRAVLNFPESSPPPSLPLQPIPDS